MKKEENPNQNYLWRKLQGHLNAAKESTLNALKERGVFVECCEERGFVYQLALSAFEEVINLEIGLKDGDITIHQMNRSYSQEAV